MEFEWDDAKDALNIAKHGVALGDAAQLDWNNGVVVPDLRRNYGEERSTIYALLGTRLYVCAFVMRNETHRIISLRKANIREITIYG